MPMIGLQLDDTKQFMNHLFKEETFDNFEVVSIQLKTMIYYEIDGQLIKEYYDTDEQQELLSTYLTWAQYKNNIVPLIKGKRPPIFFKIVFALSTKQRDGIIQKLGLNEPLIQGFYINLVYDHPSAKIMTGTNYKTFTLDKSAEEYFDSSIKKFLNKHNIGFTTGQ